MIQTVFSAGLPVSERLLVRKRRIVGTGGPGPRVAVVTGIHGDELEGQFVAYELTQLLEERTRDLCGTVDIYPALNPLGVSGAQRGVPRFDIDLDRTFPGNPKGTLTEALAAAVVADIKGAAVCVDIRSADSHMREVPQAIVDKGRMRRLLPLARVLNTRLVWVHAPDLAETQSLAGVLNALGTRAITVRMGEAMRISADSGTWLAEGIVRLLEKLDAWPASQIMLPDPIIVHDGDVEELRSGRAGVFLPRVGHAEHVSRGDVVGIVADTLSAKEVEQVLAPCDGMLMSSRGYPVVYPGSLVARVLRRSR